MVRLTDECGILIETMGVPQTQYYRFEAPPDLMPALKFVNCVYSPYHLRRVFEAVNDGVETAGVGANFMVIEPAPFEDGHYDCGTYDNGLYSITLSLKAPQYQEQLLRQVCQNAVAVLNQTDDMTAEQYSDILYLIYEYSTLRDR